MALQSLDIKQRSATTTPSTQVRETIEVAKLIDVSKPASAARPARWPAWSGTTCATKSATTGVYDNPMDLTAKSWTVMRFTEVEEKTSKLEWLIRKDGCMHCADPGCLKACPAPGAIISTPTASSISIRKTASAAATA
jgi:formate dehydrogenase iron-sulfur subunit